MADARRATLLDFAIAASLAVVPVLLVVLLGMRPFAPAEYRGGSHVSARNIAALQTFEHAIVRRDRAMAGLPDAATLVDLVPECRDAWSGRDRIREFLGRPARANSPAQRIAGELAALERTLAAMSADGNRRVTDPVGFDAVRWADAARRALANPVEAPQYPGRAFRVRCADLAQAAHALSRDNGRMLATLAWRGTEVPRTVADWRPDQYVAIGTRQVARNNPWTGMPGCVYLYDEGNAQPAYFIKQGRAASERVCREPALLEFNAGFPLTAIAGGPGDGVPADDLRWLVPPGLPTLLRPLDPLLRPNEATTNRVALDGANVGVGFSIDLTIDPALQALAQKTAACYTGRQDVCEALGIRRVEDRGRTIGHRLLESAAVRMAAVAIVDVASGRIEALAGALSPCTRQEYDGPGRSPACDARLPYPIRYRPDALANPAVLHDAMPASLVKPVMAAAFFSDPAVGGRWLAAERNGMRTTAPPTSDSVRGQLMRSSSARFLDRMFCADRGFAGCERPWEVQAAARKFGWNGGCAVPSGHCGARDLLFGRSVESGDAFDDAAPPAHWISYGRLLVEPERGPGAQFRRRAPVALDVARIKRCAEGADGRRGSGDDWEKCRGGMIVDVVAEGWGQGHARATALGAAGMMTTLAAAANGQAESRAPHLVRAVRGVAAAERPPTESAARRWAVASVERSALSSEAAQVILSGLSYSHRHGTARRACEQVLDARTCRDIDWIAGKTGTPTFRNDDRSLDELAALCAQGVKRTPTEESACGALRPYKWYVAAWRSDPASPKWTKAIAVLTERNWLADSGRIHGAGDHGPNPAAEIAFQIVGRRAGLLAEDWR